MSTSFSKLVKFLSERLHNDQCTDCESKVHYMSFKDDQLIFRYFECKKNYWKGFNKELKGFQTHMDFAMEILIYLFCY